ENGSLQRYLFVLATSAVAAGAAAVLVTSGAPGGWLAAGGAGATTPADGTNLAVWLLLAGAALATVLLRRRRLAAVIVLGVAGLMVSLTFARLSAPDLALTQLSVEVVTMILLLLALYFLPQQGRDTAKAGQRLRDGLVAGLAGLGAGGLAWAVLQRPPDSISEFYLANSLSQGGGRNVVNVILVDFRGFDTLGEITVLAIAAAAIYSLLYNVRVAYTDADIAHRAWSPDPHPLVLTVTVRALLPVALMVSIYLLLRGHNQPGGGFIAALAASVALTSQYLAHGARWTRQRLTLRYRPLIAAGLLVALLTGLGSWLFGAPFLTSSFGHFHVPLIGDVELATALLFDVGIYLTVIGAVTLMLARLGRVSGIERPEDPGREPVGGRTWSF
ncbi:MAG: DUF4040 domain-containing protein, partial [Gammaproteobacteria bacterium]|nr:DUF4040 domain-containing protein [Gammaproteobacteria bacterium]NIR96991.1 DUF4040 domain-containing protein [Gammaproteobacteria bacterium]NIT62693.1 DUF4040 domain-containing protein [Gammaproteobacteria bacterium]NIV19653.1 DUF4040 domain-containing protein [Gammaproteobacteria bacterium]NIX10873.1 DUF4040 domain-containing protein [Gammaproteobacteria bacterium]